MGQVQQIPRHLFSPPKEGLQMSPFLDLISFQENKTLGCLGLGNRGRMWFKINLNKSLFLSLYYIYIYIYIYLSIYLSIFFFFAGHQWLMHIILATQEAEIRRIEVRSQPGQIGCGTLS
jgi:hypothetical protein